MSKEAGKAGNISGFSATELMSDFNGASLDYNICRVALMLGITEDGDGFSTAERMEINQKVMLVISDEITRRGGEACAPESQ